MLWLFIKKCREDTAVTANICCNLWWCTGITGRPAHVEEVHRLA